MHSLAVRTGAELTFETLLALRDAALEAARAGQGVALLLGTDTMDEAAFALHLMLEPALAAAGRCLAITGAMRPADQISADGPMNLLAAIQARAARAASQRHRQQGVCLPPDPDRRCSRWPWTLRAAPRARCWW